MRYYDSNNMFKDRKTELLGLYETNIKYPLGLQIEIREYCVDDVDILLNACCKVRQLLKEETGVTEKVKNPHDLKQFWESQWIHSPP